MSSTDVQQDNTSPSLAIDLQAQETPEKRDEKLAAETSLSEKLGELLLAIRTTFLGKCCARKEKIS